MISDEKNMLACNGKEGQHNVTVSQTEELGKLFNLILAGQGNMGKRRQKVK